MGQRRSTSNCGKASDHDKAPRAVHSHPGAAWRECVGPRLAIVPELSWQQNYPSGTAAIWIASRRDIAETFTSGSGPIQVTAWGDSPLEVWIDGMRLSNMSLYPVGVEPANYGLFVTDVAAGSHVIEFRDFQRLLYTGTAPGSETPEPSTFVLIAIAGAALAARRVREVK